MDIYDLEIGDRFQTNSGYLDAGTFVVEGFKYSDTFGIRLVIAKDETTGVTWEFGYDDPTKAPVIQKIT
jgi:hypothetical protein